MRAKYVKIKIETATGRGVADRWERQYCRDGAWSSEERKAEWTRLRDLGADPAPEAIQAIIGNPSWTHIFCDGCSDYTSRAVVIGEYEPHRFCETCIREASAVLGDEGKQ